MTLTQSLAERQTRVWWIDHEPNAIKDVVNSIGELKCPKETAQRLDEIFVFETIGIDDSKDPAGIVEQIDVIIAQSGNAPDILFIDLNLDPKHDPGGVHIGREVALKLRDKLANTAVGIFTKAHLNPRDKIMFSADGFSALIEELSSVSKGMPQRDMTCEEWLNLFKTMRKTRRGPGFSLSELGNEPQNVSWRQGYPKSRSVSFRKAAPMLARLASFCLETAETRVVGGFPAG
jgi:hypothetical protein